MLSSSSRRPSSSSSITSSTIIMRQHDGSNAGGFNFDLVKRNAVLCAKGMKPPAAWKTGTTIAGVIFKVRRLAGREEGGHSHCVGGSEQQE